MAPQLEIGLPRADELEALGAVLSGALHQPEAAFHDFVGLLGADQLRAARQDGRVVAGLGIIPFGQWFGGRRVPVAGVTIVGVAPQARGRGVGGALMQAILREQRAAGVPLASLYPATLTFYRAVGFARAGSRITYELPLDRIILHGASAATLEPLGPEQYAAARAVYDARARATSGNLDRPEWMWRFRLEPKDRRTFRFLALRDGRPEGYVAYFQEGREAPLTVTDLCVLTPEAGRALLAMFAAHRSVIDRVIWSGGPLDPFCYLLEENLVAGLQPRAQVTRHFDWMLRVLDVRAALSARGYPPALRATLHLDVADELFPEQAGRWLVTIDGGGAQVARGGAGHIRLDIRDLATLLSGFMTPAELQPLGSLTGPADQLALLASAFAGPRPWMPDMF